MNEFIVGFDIKRINNRIARNIIAKCSCSNVCSADFSIWPSQFNTGDYPEVTGSLRKKYGLGFLELPDSVGINSPCWCNLSEMIKYYVCKMDDLTDICVVAITCNECYEDKWPYRADVIPKTLNGSWVRLGYDVLDDTQESIIINNEESELANLTKYGINQNCLFNNTKGAVRYIKDLKAQIRAEREYDIYGLYSLFEFAHYL